MKRIILITAAVLITNFLPSLFNSLPFGEGWGGASAQPLDTTFTLIVNSSAQTKILEPVFGLGALTWPWEIENTDSLQLVGMKNNFWRLGTISLDWWFPDTTALPTPQDWANFDAAAAQYAQEIFALKVKYPDVIFGADIDAMPKWLSSCANNTGCFPQWDYCFPLWKQCPPNDTAAYSMLIQRLINIFTQEGLGDFYWGVWNEPEWMFYGTQAEYLEVYKVMSLAIKQANPNAKVGGTNDVNLYVRKVEYDKNDTLPDYGAIPRSPDTLMKKLIQFVAQENLPLDFIDWHFPTTDPKGSGLENQVQDVKNWLIGNYLNPDIPIRIGEWTVSQCDEATAGELSAAYIISMLKEMARLGIPFHNHTSWTDQSGWTDGCWVDVGLISGKPQDVNPDNPDIKNHPAGVVRAKFNAFRMVSHLQNQRMTISEIDDYFADAIAASDSSKKKFSILLANYIPPGNASALRIVKEELLKQGVLDTVQLAQLDSCIRQELSTNGGNANAALATCIAMFPPSTQALIMQMITDVQNGIAMRNTTPIGINLSVAGLSDTLYEVIFYTIDWNNANECRYNKRTEPVLSSAPCGTGGAVDQLAAQVAAAADSAFWFELMVNRNWTTADSALLVSIADSCDTTATPPQCMQLWFYNNPNSFSKSDSIIIVDVVTANQIKTNVYKAGEKMAAAYLNGLPDVGLFPVSVNNIQPDSSGNISLNVNLIPNGVALVELTGLGGIVSVTDKPAMAREDVHIYPNPSNGKFFVSINNPQSTINNISIYNVLGEKVTQSVILTQSAAKGKNLTIDLSDFPKGIYFYQVTNERQLIGNGKIVIQ